MKKMALLDHNTRTSDRKNILVNKLDYLMKDLAISSPSTDHHAK